MKDLPDYYATLGVSPVASHDEIRAAYRQLARQHHPDVNSPDKDGQPSNEFMQQLNAAYEILSDPPRRSAYDRYRWIRDRLASTKTRPFSGPTWSPPPSDLGQKTQPKDEGGEKSAIAVDKYPRLQFKRFETLIGVILFGVSFLILFVVGLLLYHDFRAGRVDPVVAVAFIAIAGSIFFQFSSEWKSRKRNRRQR